jgi:hypothetical protein
MDQIIKKFSKIFNIFKKSGASCDGCVYHKAPTECNLFVITEDWISVKAKSGCDSYLCKNELLRR